MGRSFVTEKPKQFDQVATADGDEDGLEVDGISMADGDTKLSVANKFIGARPGEACWLVALDLAILQKCSTLPPFPPPPSPNPPTSAYPTPTHPHVPAPQCSKSSRAG